MRILPIYNASNGGWVYKGEDGEFVVEADTVLVGPEPKPWMTKIAMVELGICTAKEAIAEVVHEYHIKTSATSTKDRLDNYKIPPELFEQAKDPVRYPDDAKFLAEMFEIIYFNRGE